MKHLKDFLSRWYQSIIVAAAVLAYVSQPIIRFFHPMALLLFGLAFTLFVIGFAVIRGMIDQRDQYANAHDGELPPLHQVENTTIYLTGLALAVCIISIGVGLVNAARDLGANDKRCLAIQRDMLSSMPLRSDDADVFQALGCRPQGHGSVYAERDTKEDADAMFEQAARRGALPYRNPYQTGSARLK